MTLPNFVIAGATKCGTTSLFHYLGQHPQIYFSPVKEPSYFSFDPNNSEHINKSLRVYPCRTIEDYLALFDGVQEEEIAIGEATANYLHSSLAPVKMKEIMPDVRLIFSLRDPVHRLHSKAVVQFRNKLGENERDVNDFFYDLCRPGDRMAMENRYTPVFKRWLAHFDRTQMKVVLLENLKADPVALCQSVFEYLEVDHEFVPDTEKLYNVGGVPRSEFATRIWRFFSTRAFHRQRYVRKLIPRLDFLKHEQSKSVRKKTAWFSKRSGAAIKIFLQRRCGAT